MENVYDNCRTYTIKNAAGAAGLDLTHNFVDPLLDVINAQFTFPTDFETDSLLAAEWIETLGDVTGSPPNPYFESISHSEEEIKFRVCGDWVGFAGGVVDSNGDVIELLTVTDTDETHSVQCDWFEKDGTIQGFTPQNPNNPGAN